MAAAADQRVPYCSEVGWVLAGRNVRRCGRQHRPRRLRDRTLSEDEGAIIHQNVAKVRAMPYWIETAVDTGKFDMDYEPAAICGASSRAPRLPAQRGRGQTARGHGPLRLVRGPADRAEVPPVGSGKRAPAPGPPGPGRVEGRGGAQGLAAADLESPKRLPARRGTGRGGRMREVNASAQPERTPDGRYILVGNRRWRATDPEIPEDTAGRLRSGLMAARRAVKAAVEKGDRAAEQRARSQVHRAKVALGERGTPWWEQSMAERRERWERGLDSGQADQPDQHRAP